MHRRSLLVSAGAGALAFALPQPAIAAASLPYPSTAVQNKLETIEYVFRTIADYGGELGVRLSPARAFGFPKETELLRLHDLVERDALDPKGSMDMHERVEHWLTIRELLNRKFGENLPAHRFWLATTFAASPNRTCRDLLETGRLADLDIVARYALAYLA